MPTDEYAGTTRLEEVKGLVKSLQSTYPDAKKLSVEIHFEWVTTDVYDDGAELCPIVKLYMER